MVKVQLVNRTNEVEVTDGYWVVKFRYSREKGRLVTIFRGVHKSRLFEPVYVPKAIFTAFVRRAYAVFYNSRRKKEVVQKPESMQLNLF